MNCTRTAMLAGTAAGSTTFAFSGRVMAAENGVPTAAVETTSGKVRGLRAGGLSRFFGVPYGEDTGKHRFQPSRAPQPWSGVRDCNALGRRRRRGRSRFPA
jgi:para-nitrobenzyl esterase